MMHTPKLRMRVLLAGLPLLAALLAPAAPARAQAYPTKPIRLVLGYAPGGVADITARLVAQKISETLGQQVIIDNKPSAGGIVAGEAVAHADPDGYTLLHLNYGDAVSAALFRKMPYDIKRDFAPVWRWAFSTSSCWSTRARTCAACRTSSPAPRHTPKATISAR